MADVAGTEIAVSVLIPVLDEERAIETTLTAMRAQRFDGAIELIFADGGSRDRTLELLNRAADEDSRVVVVDNPRRTVSSGLNVALARARGRWIARMDAHTSYPADYLARGVARLRRGDTNWVSGPPVPVGHNPLSRAVAAALRTSAGRSGSRKWATETSSERGEYLLDSGVFAGVWARETLERHGGWDEQWVVNEDSEMAGRFLASGERLVCLPAMAARYSPRDSVRGLWRQYERYGRFRVKTAVRHPDTLRRPHLLAPMLAFAVASASVGPRPLRTPARASLAAYAAFLARTIPAGRAAGLDGREALLVPVALATMHIGWGVGIWDGMVRYGVPLRAFARAVRPPRSGDA